MPRFFPALLLTLVLASSPSRVQAQVTQVFSQADLTGSLTVHDFESSDFGPGAWYVGSAQFPTSAANSGPSSTSGLFGLLVFPPNSIEVSFWSPVLSVGMFFGNDDLCCGAPFSAFLDVFGNTGLLGTVSVAANMNDAADQYLGLNSTSAITSARVRYDNPSLAIFVDDVAFGAPTTVPEPGTVGLVAAGLLGMAGMAKRRKRIAA